LLLGAIASFEEAIYFSTISYSTLGLSDVTMASQWRLLGAFESILGMILIGWSTAFFFLILRRIDAH
jgi:Ion channel